MASLLISERDLRANCPGSIFSVTWRQRHMERRLARRGVCFRSTSFEKVVQAYAAMSQDEFEAINGRQDWANWRTIPRALSGNVPDRPLRVLDLGCGTGSSTQVLAFYCPVGSHLTAFEIAAPLLVCAQRRPYCHRSGAPVRVDFVHRPFAEALCGGQGQAIPARSVDLINASGVIGHHLTEKDVVPLLGAMGRVLSLEGAALLDCGPTLPARRLRRMFTEAGFECRGQFHSWLGDRTGQLLFRPGLGARLHAAESLAPAGVNKGRGRSKRSGASDPAAGRNVEAAQARGERDHLQKTRHD